MDTLLKDQAPSPIKCLANYDLQDHSPAEGSPAQSPAFDRRSISSLSSISTSQASPYHAQRAATESPGATRTYNNPAGAATGFITPGASTPAASEQFYTPNEQFTYTNSVYSTPNTAFHTAPGTISKFAAGSPKDIWVNQRVQPQSTSSPEEFSQQRHINRPVRQALEYHPLGVDESILNSLSSIHTGHEGCGPDAVDSLTLNDDGDEYEFSMGSSRTGDADVQPSSCAGATTSHQQQHHHDNDDEAAGQHVAWSGAVSQIYPTGPTASCPSPTLKSPTAHSKPGSTVCSIYAQATASSPGSSHHSAFDAPTITDTMVELPTQLLVSGVSPPQSSEDNDRSAPSSVCHSPAWPPVSDRQAVQQCSSASQLQPDVNTLAAVLLSPSQQPAAQVADLPPDLDQPMTASTHAPGCVSSPPLASSEQWPDKQEECMPQQASPSPDGSMLTPAQVEALWVDEGKTLPVDAATSATSSPAALASHEVQPPDHDIVLPMYASSSQETPFLLKRVRPPLEQVDIDDIDMSFNRSIDFPGHLEDVPLAPSMLQPCAAQDVLLPSSTDDNDSLPRSSTASVGSTSLAAALRTSVTSGARRVPISQPASKHPPPAKAMQHGVPKQAAQNRVQQQANSVAAPQARRHSTPHASAAPSPKRASTVAAVGGAAGASRGRRVSAPLQPSAKSPVKAVRTTATAATAASAVPQAAGRTQQCAAVAAPAQPASNGAGTNAAAPGQRRSSNGSILAPASATANPARRVSGPARALAGAKQSKLSGTTAARGAPTSPAAVSLSSASESSTTGASARVSAASIAKITKQAPAATSGRAQQQASAAARTAVPSRLGRSSLAAGQGSTPTDAGTTAPHPCTAAQAQPQKARAVPSAVSPVHSSPTPKSPTAQPGPQSPHGSSGMPNTPGAPAAVILRSTGKGAANSPTGVMKKMPSGSAATTPISTSKAATPASAVRKPAQTPGSASSLRAAPSSPATALPATPGAQKPVQQGQTRQLPATSPQQVAGPPAQKQSKQTHAAESCNVPASSGASNRAASTAPVTAAVRGPAETRTKTSGAAGKRTVASPPAAAAAARDASRAVQPSAKSAAAAVSPVISGADKQSQEQTRRRMSIKPPLPAAAHGVRSAAAAAGKADLKPAPASPVQAQAHKQPPAVQAAAGGADPAASKPDGIGINTNIKTAPSSAPEAAPIDLKPVKATSPPQKAAAGAKGIAATSRASKAAATAVSKSAKELALQRLMQRKSYVAPVPKLAAQPAAKADSKQEATGPGKSMGVDRAAPAPSCTRSSASALASRANRSPAAWAAPVGVRSPATTPAQRPARSPGVAPQPSPGSAASKGKAPQTTPSGAARVQQGPARKAFGSPSSAPSSASPASRNVPKSPLSATPMQTAPCTPSRLKTGSRSAVIAPGSAGITLVPPATSTNAMTGTPVLFGRKHQAHTPAAAQAAEATPAMPALVPTTQVDWGALFATPHTSMSVDMSGTQLSVGSQPAKWPMSPTSSSTSMMSNPLPHITPMVPLGFPMVGGPAAGPTPFDWDSFMADHSPAVTGSSIAVSRMTPGSSAQGTPVLLSPDKCLSPAVSESNMARDGEAGAAARGGVYGSFGHVRISHFVPVHASDLAD